MWIISLVGSVLFLVGSFGEDSLSEITISPQSNVQALVGDNRELKCDFNPNVIKRIFWLAPGSSKNPIQQGSDERRILLSDGDNLNLILKNISLSDKGKYRCRGIRVGSGAAYVDKTIDIEVTDPVSFAGTSSIQNFNLHSTATVDCSFTGVPEPKIFWQKQGGSNIVSGGRYSVMNGQLNITSVTEEDEGSYVCAGSQPNGNFDDILIKVLINSPPKILRFKENLTWTAGDVEEVTCKAEGDPQPDVRLYFVNDSSKVLVSNTSSKSFDVERSLDGASIQCYASNIAGKVNATAKIIVYEKPSFIECGDATAVESDNATLKCVATGNPPPELWISRNDVKLEESGMPELVNVSSSNDTTGSFLDNPTVVYNGSTATVTFNPVTYEDRGDYCWHARNVADNATKTVKLRVMFAPKKRTSVSTKWACEDPGRVASLSCDVVANPPANFSWGRADNLLDNNTVGNYTLFEDFPKGYSTSEDGDILHIEISEADEAFGDYVCMAENSIDYTLVPLKLLRAESPRSPYYLNVMNVTTRSALIRFYVPPTADDVPYQRFIVKLHSSSGKKKKKIVKAITDEESYEVEFSDLEPNTNYTVTISSENCKSTSRGNESLSFKTDRIRIPNSVDITSGSESAYRDRYTVEWQLNHLGGGGAVKIALILFKVQGSNKTFVDEEEINDQSVKNGTGSHKFKDLNPDFKYEVEVIIHNEVGSASSSKRFSLNATAVEVTDRDDAIGKSDGTMIGIIVAGLIVIIIIIDLIFCCKRNCGLAFCVHSALCGKQRENDVEEGKTELRAKDDEIVDQSPLNNISNGAGNGKVDDVTEISDQNGVNEETNVVAPSEKDRLVEDTKA